jgi:HAMP domain-containing protein
MSESEQLFVVTLKERIEDESKRQSMAEKLAPALKLPIEQVLKLVSRPPGPLVKPTQRAKAEKLANAFSQLGAQVEVTLAGGAAGGAVAPTLPPTPVAPAPEAVHHVSAAPEAVHHVSAAPEAVHHVSAAPETMQPMMPEASVPLAADASGDFESFLRAQAGNKPSDSKAAGFATDTSSSFMDSNVTGSSGNGSSAWGAPAAWTPPATEPSSAWGAPVSPNNPPISAPVSEASSAWGAASTPINTPINNPAPAWAPPAPSGPVPDAWSSPPTAPVGETPRSAAAWGGGAPASSLGSGSGPNSMAAASSNDEADEIEESSSNRRGSIARKFVLATLIPAALIGLVALFFIAFRITSGFDTLIKDKAKDVLIALVNNIDTADFLGSRDQMDAITRTSNVGFVLASKDENTAFFSAKNVDKEKVIRDAVDKLADTQGTLAVADESFTVASANVYLGTSGNGAREIIFAGDNKVTPPTKLFSIRVGVLDKEARGFVTGQVVQFIILLILALAAAVFVAIFVARRVTEPVLHLTQAANRISLGEFGESIQVESNDELGDLAEALERMRTSLETAMARMRKRR